MAQDAASTAYRIPLSTYVYHNGTMNSSAQTALERKAGSLATINGYGSTSGDFLLAAEGGLVDCTMTATVPVRYVASVEVSVAVVNTLEMVVVDSNVFSLKGIGSSKDQAILNAINQLNPRSEMCVKFMTDARAKIETYYKHQLTNIKAKAASAIERGEYKQALAILGSVPESLAEYPEVAKMMTDCYLKMVDRDAAEMLQKAKAAYAERNYHLALNILGKINPLSNKYQEAEELINKIAEFHEKEYQTAEKERIEDRQIMIEARKDAVRLAEMRINSAKEVAIANAAIISQERQSSSEFNKVLLAAIASRR